jgi:hypothetical protein
MNEINVSLTKEEIRIIHQSLNEICNGIHFEDSEFETRVGTDRDTAIALMKKLEVFHAKG